MKKVYNVKEFQTIVKGDRESSPDSDLFYLPSDTFERLVNVVKEYTSENEDDADIHEMMKIGHKKGLGDTVTIKNYVGLIQMDNNVQIQIWPKIELSSNTVDYDFSQTKSVFLSMLRCMKEFHSKSFSTANISVANMNLYEIFISMYIQEIKSLVKAGIKSSYQSAEDNLNTIRGKLLIKEQIAKNITHKEKFYCAYDEYSIDRPENRLIKSTLLLLSKITESPRNAKDIRDLLTHFEFVEPSKNIDADFSLVKIDRSTKHYELALRWSKVFLKHKSFTTFTGENKSRALLFQMDKLFEAYVAKCVSSVFTPFGWNVSTQDEGYYLFEEPSKQFSLRPDIVLSKGDRTVIFDTKWKRINANKDDNYGISQSDMYQMYAYAKKYNTSEIHLLYPNNSDVANISFDPFVSKDLNDNVEACVNVEKIQLDDVKNCFSVLASSLK